MIGTFIAAAPDTSGMFEGVNIAGITAVVGFAVCVILVIQGIKIMFKSDKQELGKTMTTSTNAGVGMTMIGIGFSGLVVLGVITGLVQALFPGAGAA